ncbi:VOC family protein [Shinella sumterensis]|uniref:VOC family protein n=1 Tax=Shinella sumterensis TaxID=1967501 RepID=UPI003F8240EE
MAEGSSAISVTTGVDHIGLTVGDLSASLAFFTECLGWRLFGEKPDYPAAFVTDGHLKLTLWEVKDQTNYQGFDRRHNVGLHHLALKVLALDDLHLLYERIKEWPSVTTEFGPELSGAGLHRSLYCARLHSTSAQKKRALSKSPDQPRR